MAEVALNAIIRCDGQDFLVHTQIKRPDGSSTWLVSPVNEPAMTVEFEILEEA